MSQDSSPRSTLDTPALLADLDVMEANIAHIAQVCRAHGVRWRPHFKGHKTLEIAQMQISAGAIGITCAKLGEAEILAANGIHDSQPDRRRPQDPAADAPVGQR